jgi:uncharacterized protein YjbI with pentapeptide repeats
MANPEHLKILKQGVEVWNKWREENSTIFPDLSHADLRRDDLRGANLQGVNLRAANLQRTNLEGADLFGTDLIVANLNGANLKHTKLSDSNLMSAKLKGADLTDANLTDANLTDAMLADANLTATKLRKTKLFNIILWETILVNLDLNNAIGLEEIFHGAPSYISIDTIQRGKGKIPETFLRGCGLSDWEIESTKLYNPDLSNQEIDEILYRMHDLRAKQPLQISPLFISYSHADGKFVDRMESQLNQKGIRFWRDVHHAMSGRLEKQIDRAIRHNPTVLVILSENSTQSDWVEHEVRTARELEKDIGRDVLCPVALDDSWKDSPWPKRVMEQVLEYNILDFSEWKDDVKFEGMFRRLIDGLELFYKG